MAWILAAMPAMTAMPAAADPHTINFLNKGPAQIELYLDSSECMHDAGQNYIYINSYDDTQSIKVEDSNNFLQGCTDDPKWIKWHVYTTYYDGGEAKQGEYYIKFIHGRTPATNGAWGTEIGGPKGNSDGRGMLSGATCDGTECLNSVVAGGGDTEEIVFDAGYVARPYRSVEITSPPDRSAVPMGAGQGLQVSGLGTAKTQVNVTTDIAGFNPSTLVNENDEWSIPVPHTGNANQLSTITATATVGGGSSDTVTFVTIIPATIFNPPAASVPWTDKIQVGGQGNPSSDSIVTVSAHQGNTLVSGCSAPVKNDSSWSCALEGLAAGQDYKLVTSQVGMANSGGDTWFWISPGNERTIHVDALPLAITSPAPGGHIDGDNPDWWAITGTGTPNGQVQLWVLPSSNSCGDNNNSGVTTVAINGDGKWSTPAAFRFPPGQDYTVQACQTVNGEAASGATSSFASWYSLKITNPANGTVFASNTTSIPMNGTGEPGATLVPSSVFLCPNRQIAPNGQWSCPISGVTAGGDYSFSIQQSKNAQSDPSVPVQFSIAKAITIDQPAQGQQFPVQTMQVPLQGSGQPGAVLSVDVPGATACPKKQPILIPKSGQWSCLVSDLEPDHSYTASMVQGSSDDVSAGMAWKDPPVLRQFSVAGFTPLVIGNPTNGQWFSSATTTITASGSGQTGAQLTIAVPGAATCPEQTIQSGGQWSCEISGLMPGHTYDLTVTQSLHGVTDTPVSVTFGTATPVVIENPRENTVLAAASTEVMMSGTGQPGAAINVTTNSVPQCNNARVENKGQWRCNIQGLVAGTHYTSQVIQSDGWVDPPVKREFSIAKAKAIAIQSPADHIMVSSNNPPDGLRVIGTGQSGATADVTVGALPMQSAYIPDGAWATAPFDLSKEYSAGGAVQITATEHLDGSPQGAPAQVNITVAKVATITNPTENAVEPPGPLTVAGFGQDGATVTVQPTQEGEGHECSATVKGGAWSCVVTGLAPSSQYSLVVTQSGTHAEWTDLPIIRKFSTRGASPLVITYPGKNVPPDTPYDVRGTGQPDAEVELKSFNLISLGKTTVGGNGQWEFRNLLSSGEGCYSLTAEQTWQGYPLTNPPGVAPPVVWYSAGSQSCP